MHLVSSLIFNSYFFQNIVNANYRFHINIKLDGIESLGGIQTILSESMTDQTQNINDRSKIALLILMRGKTADCSYNASCEFT